MVLNLYLQRFYTFVYVKKLLLSLQISQIQDKLFAIFIVPAIIISLLLG